MVPNQKFIYNKTTASAHVAENVNVLPAIAWKENLLIMDSQSLAEVLKTIEAHYGIAFSYNWKKENGEYTHQRKIRYQRIVEPQYWKISVALRR